MAERKPVQSSRTPVGARRVVQGGGRRPVGSGRGAWGASSGKPGKKKSGSLLGNLAHETYSAIAGIPSVPGVVGGAIAHDVHKVFEHPLRNSSIWNYATGGKQPHSEVWDKLLHPSISNAWWHVDPLLHGDVGKTYGRIKEDPLNPIIDVAAILTGGAARGLAVSDARALNLAMRASDETAAASRARIAKAIVTGRYQRDPGAITVQSELGAPVTVRQLPRNAYRAARMQATDRLLKTVDPSTAVFGEYARAARKLKTNSVRRQLHFLANKRYEAYTKAWSKLDVNQRVAVGLLARVPLAKDLEAWVTRLPVTEEGNAMRALVTNPDVLKHYHEAYGPDGQPATAVGVANEAARKVSHAREDILRATTPIADDTIEAAKYRQTRAARGAEFVEPTPGRMGVQSAPHRSKQARVERLQKQVDLLTAKTSGTGKWKGKFLPDRPRTFEEAQTELDRLQTAHNAGLEKIRQAWFGKSDKSDVAFRNRENAKAARQRAGVTRAGKRSGASGRKATQRKTFVQETRDLTLQRLEQMQRDHPDHPVVKAWFSRADEIDKLQNAINDYKLGSGPTYEERQAARQAELPSEPAAGPAIPSRVDEIQARLDAIKEIDDRPFKPDMFYGKKDDMYGSVVSSAGRVIKWHKFPSKRAAVLDYWTRALEKEKARVGTSAGAAPLYGEDVVEALKKAPGRDSRPAKVTLVDDSIHEVNPLHPVSLDGSEVHLLDGSSVDSSVVKTVQAGNDELLAAKPGAAGPPAPAAEKPVEAPFGMMTEKPPPGAVPLRGQWTMAERRRIGHVFEPSNREFDVEGEIKGLNKQIRDLEKTLPPDSPEVLSLIKQQMAWQKINLLARSMGSVAQAMAEHGGTLTNATKIPSREEMAAIIADIKQKVYDSRASSRDVRNVINQLSRVLEELRKERKRLNTGSRQLPSGQVITATGDILHPRGYHALQRKSAALSVAKEELASADQAALNRVQETGLVGGGTPEEIRAEIEAANRPQPYYVPDMPMTETGPKVTPGPGASGLTPRRDLADIRQSHLTNFNMGMLALHSDLIGPAYLRAVAHDYYLDLHSHALQVARAFGENERLPAGWQYVREVRGQKIPHEATAKAEHTKALGKAFPDISDYQSLTLKKGEEGNLSIVSRDAEGRLLAVPKRFADTLHAEQRAAATGVRLFMGRLTNVWRSLVLHLRIPWLENNVLGNGLLWTIRFAGIDGLKSILGLIRTTKGGAAAAKALGFAQQHGHLTEDDVRELAAEQHRGTFIDTQLPKTKLGRWMNEKGGLLSKIQRFGPQTWLPALDRATEMAYRRTALETVLRGTPEVKALYNRLEPDTRTMREAMREGLKDPRIRDLASREVNDALGDFLSLSPMERHAIRGVVPFYAWYREITRIALKLPLDHPARTAILLQLGQIAQQQNDDRLGPLPTYLRGAMAVGRARGDLQGILNLNAANPFSTNLQLGLGAAAAVGIGSHQRAGAGNLLGTVSPFYSTPFDYLQRLKSGNTVGPGGLPGYMYQNFLKQLPEVRPMTAKPSPLYPGRSQSDLWRNFAGVPTTTISKAIAAKYAREGR